MYVDRATVEAVILAEQRAQGKIMQIIPKKERARMAIFEKYIIILD